MRSRYPLLQRGLFPETLPPCFTSVDLKRALRGIVGDLTANALRKRPADYVPYSGTKHDGSRRQFGTPNPIPYFHVASFVARHWRTFERRFAASPFSVSSPRLAPDGADRPIVIPSLSELAAVASRNLGHSSHVLKTDVAQFFPSIYTHSIPWSAHGVEAAKADRSERSASNTFNQLDLFVQSCQRGETRGLLVGPDAFRLIAEFIAAGIDVEIRQQLGDRIVGAARHVDDYYIGIGNEAEALFALSAVREALLRMRLNVNDTKTRVMLGVEPLNELWAQRLRRQVDELTPLSDHDEVTLVLTEALALAWETHSDSPVKIMLRGLDEIAAYDDDDAWATVEPHLQRILHHHPHCLDYIALLAVKRHARGHQVDREGWRSVAHTLAARHLPLNHHHEAVWLTWMLLSIDLGVEDRLAESLAESGNAHVTSLVVAAHLQGKIPRRPRVQLGQRLASTDANWLVNIVARAGGHSRASFGGALAAEFEHLAAKRLSLLDLDAHMAMAATDAKAISRTRYGYDQPDASQDSDDEDDDEMRDATDFEDVDDDLGEQFLERIGRDNT